VKEFATKRRLGQITHRPDSTRINVKVAPGTVNTEIAILRAVMNRARNMWKVNIAEIGWKLVFLESASERQHILARRDDTLDVHPGSETRLFTALREDLHAFTRFGLLSGMRVSNILTSPSGSTLTLVSVIGAAEPVGMFRRTGNFHFSDSVGPYSYLMVKTVQVHAPSPIFFCPRVLAMIEIFRSGLGCIFQ
jgi:hypothetical protein